MGSPRRASGIYVAMGGALLVVFLAGSSAHAEIPLMTRAEDRIDEEPASTPAPVDAQDESGSTQEPTGSAPSDTEPVFRLLRCPTPARFHGLYLECVGNPFESVADTLTRDWAGFRTLLTRLGITPTGSYTAQLMGNPSGGRSQGFAYAGELDALIAWDLHRLLGVPGLSFTVGASWSTGKSLSAQDIDNAFTVQSAFSGTGNVRLQQMYLQQQFFDGALTIAAGRLAPANTFAALPVFNNYLNGGINPVPGSLTINDPTFMQSPPGVEWGAQAVYHVTPAVQVSVGVYNTNPSAAAGADHGVNFSLQQGNRGVLTVVELDYQFNQAKGDAGMPGQYTIGGFYDSNTFSSLSVPAGTVSGNAGFYAMFQQMVYRDGGPGSWRGLTVWAEVAVSPNPSASAMPYFLGGGISYQGLIPGRGKDIASLGGISGTFSHHIPSTSAETVIEVSYQAALIPGLSITPDVQYVIKPSGNSRIKNAVVIGAQLAVTF